MNKRSRSVMECAQRLDDEGVAGGASSADPGMYWPFQATIRKVDLLRLTFDKPCPLVEPGVHIACHSVEEMRHMDEDAATEAAELAAAVTWVSPDGKTVLVQDRLPVGTQVGKVVTLFTSTVPSSVSTFRPHHCLQLLSTLVDTVRSEEFQQASSAVRVGMLYGEPTVDDTPEAASEAHVRNMNMIMLLQRQCEQLGLLTQTGDPFPVGLARYVSSRLTFLDAALNRVFETAFAERAYRRLCSDGCSRSAVAADAKRGSMWHFSHEDPFVVRPTDEPPSKDEQLTELVKYWLDMAYARGLRQKDGLLYERVTTEVDVWQPIPGTPLCQECGDPAAFCEAGDALGVRVRCPDHRRPTDVDARLECVPVTGTAGRSTWRMRPAERRVVKCDASAWVLMMDGPAPMKLETWVNRQISAVSQSQMFKAFMGKHAQAVRTMVSYASAADHPLLPQFRPDRDWMSFRNGRYNIATNTFVEYGPGGQVHQGVNRGDYVPLSAVDAIRAQEGRLGKPVRPDDDVCCVNHVQEWFDPALVALNPMDIPTPGLTDILESQSFDPETVKVVKLMLGRLFFILKRFDEWEKIMLIVGVGGCGKSTIVGIILYLLGHMNVGLIDANCEPMWALSAVWDKLVWVIAELSKTWNLSNDTLKSMVSSDPTAIKTKGKTPFSQQWMIPGLCVGNETPTAWMGDQVNALARRILMVNMSKVPHPQDPRVAHQLFAGCANFLAACTQTYLQVVQELGGRPLDDILSTYLRDGKDDFLKRTQPLMRFLSESEHFALAEANIRTPVWTAVEKHQRKARPGQLLTSVDTPEAKALEENYSVPLQDVARKFQEWFAQMFPKQPVPPMGRLQDIAGTLAQMNLYALSVDNTGKRLAHGYRIVGIKACGTEEERGAPMGGMPHHGAVANVLAGLPQGAFVDEFSPPF